MISNAVKACEVTLANLKNRGLVEAHPVALRAEVDDALWASLPKEEKKEVLQALACFAFNGELPRGNEYAVIYGYDTGQRLAVISRFGAEFDPIRVDELSKLPDFGS